MEGFVRRDQIIVNKNMNEYDSYCEKRRLILENKENKVKINSLENEVSEIKSLLVKLIGNN